MFFNDVATCMQLIRYNPLTVHSFSVDSNKTVYTYGIVPLSRKCYACCKYIYYPCAFTFFVYLHLGRNYLEMPLHQPRATDGMHVIMMVVYTMSMMIPRMNLLTCMKACPTQMIFITTSNPKLATD